MQNDQQQTDLQTIDDYDQRWQYICSLMHQISSDRIAHNWPQAKHGLEKLHRAIGMQIHDAAHLSR